MMSCWCWFELHLSQQPPWLVVDSLVRKSFVAGYFAVGTSINFYKLVIKSSKISQLRFQWHYVKLSAPSLGTIREPQRFVQKFSVNGKP